MQSDVLYIEHYVIEILGDLMCEEHDSEVSGVEEAAKIVVLAKKLVEYRCVLSSAFAFFIFGMTFASIISITVSICVALSIPLELWAPIAFSTVVLCTAVGILLLRSVAPMCRYEELGSEPSPRLRLYYALSFILPFVVLYMLPIPDTLIPYVVRWLPALGIALLAAHFTVERRIPLNTKFMLLASVLLLVFTPISIAIELSVPGMGGVASTGFMLLSYLIAGVHALRRAKKIFE